MLFVHLSNQNENVFKYLNQIHKYKVRVSSESVRQIVELLLNLSYHYNKPIIKCIYDLVTAVN